MRIISGDFKGRRLEMPVGNDIRPTTEKVKEAVFSTIQAHLYDAVVVDLFSGTGNLGLEALSRGAQLCYFCDNARASIELTKRNIELCKAGEYSQVVPGSFEKCLMKLGEKGEKVDIFFIDPPYKEGLYDRCFELIREYDLLAEDGIIVAEHNYSDKFETEICGFEMIKEKKFGTICFSIYG